MVEREAGQVDVTTVGQTDTAAMQMDAVHVPKKCQTFSRNVLFEFDF